MSKKRALRKSKNNHTTRINRMCVGLTMQWFDTNPRGDKSLKISDVSVSHLSPAFRMKAMEFWRDNAEYLRTKSCWSWKIEITSVFEWDKRVQHETRELNARCVISDIAQHVNSAIDDTMRHGCASKFKGTQFKLTCLNY